MFATVRRFEGVAARKKAELAKKVKETLAPRLSKLPGFGSYFLIDTGEGVMSSIGLFDTSAQANESTRVASEWVRDEKLGSSPRRSPEGDRRRGHRPQDEPLDQGVSAYLVAGKGPQRAGLPGARECL